MSICCVRCKSVSKLPIFCNSCYQESFKSGERRGRKEELKELYDWINKEENRLDKKNSLDFLCYSIGERIQKRLLELEKRDLK